jgi:solute carrier family 50 protein (sugar transporter)
MDIDYKQEIVGWTAFTFSAYFLLSPVFSFINVIKGKITFEEAPGAYVTLNYISCFCWYIYGDMLYSDQIKIINLIGMVASGIFILIYLYYEIRKYVVDTVLNALLLGSGSYMMYLTLTIMIDDDTIIGKICATAQCLLHYFPIKNIYQVIKEKNFMLIPFCTAWGHMLCSICWALYGIMTTEVYVVIPQCIGIILSTVQVILFLNYRKAYPIYEINKNSSLGGENFENFENKKDEQNKDDIVQDEEINDSNIKERPVKILEKEN